MTTAITQPAKREHVEAHAATGTLAGIDAQDFVRDNRIHVKDGSLFVDPYLAIHPRELAPANEAKLRDKLRLTYSVNNPSFYESPERLMIALNLGQLIPVSLAAKRSKLMEEVHQLNAEIDGDSGADTAQKRQLVDRAHPFAAIVRDTIEKPQQDPVGVEMLKNGLGVYLLLREKLTSLGYLDKLSDYVPRHHTPDQVLSDLADKIGVPALAMREAAKQGGMEAVGKLLKLDPAYVADVKKLVEYAATQDFGFNVIEQWHLGRQLLGVGASLEQKMATGLDARVTHAIEDFRNRKRHFYEVPTPIKAEEKRIAEALNLVEPIQRALMHKLGYEICYTPEYLADDIAHYRGVYGLHRKAASDLRDVRGTYRIYFSGRGDLKASMRTLVHEVAHNLWPEQFTPEEVKKVDALAASDATRFVALHRLMSEKFNEFDKFLRAYQAGSDAEKAAIVQTTKAYFTGYGISIDEGVLATVRDANELRYLAAYAVDALRVEGARYAKSGYDMPQERFREVISRFAELKQVELSGNPRLMQFLAPGLNQVWENHYIPHLKRVYQKLNDKGQASSVSRDVAPLAQTSVEACASDASPSHQIDAATIAAHAPALSALSAMHVNPHR